MNFADPGLLASAATVYTGVPIGKTRLLPAGSYTPQVALTNFTDTAQSVTVTAASTVNGVSDRHEIAAFSIPASSSQMAELKGLRGDPGWQNSFIVQSTGGPGDVLSKMMFRSHAALPNIELIGKDEKSPYTAGDHPWSVEDGNISTLFLFNHSDAVRSVSVRLGSGDSIWLQNYDLKPNETRAISINDVENLKTPDMDGRLLAATVLNGEAAWWASNAGTPEVTGRVVQIDSAGTMARNFSCPLYFELCSVSQNPLPLNILINGVEATTGVAKVCAGSEGPDPCDDNGQYTTMNKTVSWSWLTQKAGIAQIVSGAHSQTSTWQGMAAGYTQSFLTVSGAGYPCTGGGDINVLPGVSYSNLKDLALGTGDASGAITSNQLTAVGSPSGGTYSWTASNNSVSLTNSSSATVTTTASSAGQSSITVTYTVNGQSASANGTINVYQPSAVSILSDTGVTLSNSCFSGVNQYNGPARSVNYQIQANQNGTMVPVTADVSLSESFTVLGSPGPSCGPVPMATQNLTTHQTFSDNFTYCSTNCLPASNSTPKGSCTLALEHAWTANGFTVFDHTLTYTCTNITPQ